MATYHTPIQITSIFNSSDYKFQDEVISIQQADARYLNITNDNEYYYTTKTRINNNKAKLVDFSRSGTVLSIANSFKVNGLFKPTGKLDLTQCNMDYNPALTVSNCYTSGKGAGNFYQALGSTTSYTNCTNVGFNSCATGNTAGTVAGGTSFGSFSSYTNPGVSNSAGHAYCSFGLNSNNANTSLGACAFGNYSASTCPTTNNINCFGISAFRNLTGSSSITGANTAFGFECAKLAGTTCARNALFGVQCMNGSGSTGLNDNACFGFQCMTTCSSSSVQNSCMGSKAGQNITTGNNNCLLGFNAGTSSSPSGNITTASNRICLGNSSITNFYAQVAITVVSDERDKTDIENLPINGLDYVMQLQPKLYKMNDRNKYNGEENDGSKADSEYSVGFLAQDIQTTEQNLNIPNSFVLNNISEDKLGLTKENILPFLVDAIKKQHQTLLDITAQVEALENA